MLEEPFKNSNGKKAAEGGELTWEEAVRGG
jgi:hypothetical protein